MIEGIHPLTGEREKKHYRRAHGCSCEISSATMDFFRSGTIGFYDRADDSGYETSAE